MPGWRAVILCEERDEEAAANAMGRVAIDLSASPLAWFEGYDADPVKTTEKFGGAGRWYRTGDTGSVDEDGYFHFSARDDDVITRSYDAIGRPLSETGPFGTTRYGWRGSDLVHVVFRLSAI